MKHKFINKKTGAEARVIAMYLDSDGVMQVDGYDVVEDLMDDYAAYEDYKPVEPLIKDEKIRKAVRAWAEVNEVVKAFVVVNEHMNWTIYGDDIDRNRFRIEFFNRVVSENDETKDYTIAELCGEEEE